MEKGAMGDLIDKKEPSIFNFLPLELAVFYNFLEMGVFSGIACGFQSGANPESRPDDSFPDRFR